MAVTSGNSSAQPSAGTVVPSTVIGDEVLLYPMSASQYRPPGVPASCGPESVRRTSIVLA